MRKTARPVVWEGGRAKSRSLHPMTISPLFVVVFGALHGNLRRIELFPPPVARAPGTVDPERRIAALPLCLLWYPSDFGRLRCHTEETSSRRSQFLFHKLPVLSTGGNRGGIRLLWSGFTSAQAILQSPINQPVVLSNTRFSPFRAFRFRSAPNCRKLDARAVLGTWDNP